MKFNDNLIDMEKEDIFEKVSEKVKVFQSNNKDVKIISLGVGDVSKPIIKPIINAMHQAVDDLSSEESFRGYGAYFGYDFLKEAIIKSEYEGLLSQDEIYVSAGSKTDTTSILELFDINSKILITDIMYPVYRDGAKALNRNVRVMPIASKDKFIASPPEEHFDIVYLCSPNNPIGIAYTKNDLTKWINYAKEHKAIILYDNVYSEFIRSQDVPKTIYEIEGAKEVAIEFRSFSKHASFTGVRCSYYAIPKEIDENINLLWQKRTINRFNGADYIAQRGAAESLASDTKKMLKANIDGYLANAKLLKSTFKEAGFTVWGGEDSPFLWIKTKDQSSWEVFDYFLKELNIIIIPGVIFGPGGEGYFRISALAKTENISEAINRINQSNSL